MNLNPPAKVRAIIYIVTGILTPIIGVLTEQNFLPGWAMTLWTAEVAVVMGLAGINVATK